MLIKYNPDYMRRDQILGLNSNIWEDDIFGKVVHLDSISLPVLESLLEEKFISLDERQNNSPTVEQFMNFMRKHPAALARGYAVSPYRRDYRITIVGLFVEHDQVTLDMWADFHELCQDADEFEADYDLYSWWD
ncbi:MAG TPA: hypothetical protein VFZ76_19515 [Anaerolineales bacterium]